MVSKTDVVGNCSFLLQVSKNAAPLEVEVKPEFSSFPVDQYFIFGASMTYGLPNYFSSEGYDVALKVSMGSIKWLSFNADTDTFKVIDGSTTADDIGGYAIKLDLEDEKGTQATYSFLIYVEDDPSRYIVAEDKSKYAPIPSVSISNKGKLTIDWDKRIKVPRNLTETRNRTVQYFDPLTEELSFKESLEINILPGLD